MNMHKIVNNLKCRIREEIEAEGETFSLQTRGEVMWALVRDLTNKQSSPYLRLIDFEEMLSPFSEEFDLTIPPEIMENIKGLATTIIAEAREKDITITPVVRRHLDKISAGWVPYGYTVYSPSDEDEDGNL